MTPKKDAQINLRIYYRNYKLLNYLSEITPTSTKLRAVSCTIMIVTGQSVNPGISILATRAQA